MESKEELKEQFVHTKFATGLVIPALIDRLKVIETHWHTDIMDEQRRRYAIEKNCILFFADLFGLKTQVNSDAPYTDGEHPSSASSDSEGT